MARIELVELDAIDAGERRAEPHLWSVFFKVDGSTFGTVLAQKLERGRIKPEELEHRGIGAVAQATDSSFHAPAHRAGEMRGVKTGDRVDLDLGWATPLSGDGILHDDDVAIGCFVVGWEIDDGQLGGKKKRYDEFVAGVRQRVFRGVAEAIDAQRMGSGPYRFPIRNGAYLRQLNDHHRQIDKAAGVFATQDHEVSLAERWTPPIRVGVDSDDLLGTLVFCAKASNLADGVMKRLWLPTSGSQEGSWRLRFSARR